MRPITLKTHEVTGILDDRQTQIRRIIKCKYNNTHIKWRTDKYGAQLVEMQNDVEGETHGKNSDGSTWCKFLAYRPLKPKYQAGDILWVRETWAEKDSHYFCKAGHELLVDGKPLIERWHPSIHMPREAARLFIRVTNVRVERLQDITEEDAMAEGARADTVRHMSIDTRKYNRHTDNAGKVPLAIVDFIGIWNSIVKKSDLDTYGWNANPWVYVYEFERISQEEAERLDKAG